eukprot:6421681-Ditylum_brightwellii.AAC.1
MPDGEEERGDAAVGFSGFPFVSFSLNLLEGEDVDAIIVVLPLVTMHVCWKVTGCVVLVNESGFVDIKKPRQ